MAARYWGEPVLHSSVSCARRRRSRRDGIGPELRGMNVSSGWGGTLFNTGCASGDEVLGRPAGASRTAALSGKVGTASALVTT